MIRIDDPSQVGPAVEALRTMLGLPRRELARAIARRTGRMPDSVNTQLWQWERGGSPNPASLGPALAELGWQLALVPVIETAPEVAPESTLAAEHPSPGVLGCTGGSEIESGASEAWPNGVRCPVVGDWCPGNADGALCTQPCNPEEDA